MEAVKDAGLEGFGGDLERVGVCIGSGIGGLPMIEETHAKYAPLWAELRKRAQPEVNGDAGNPG